MPCYLMSVQICGNLNVENKMQDTGKGTSWIVENNGNVSLGHGLWFTYCKSEILKTLE